MIRGLLAALLALLAAAAPVRAAESDNLEAMAGRFKIFHVWARDQEQFLEEWRQPTPPRLTTSSRFERNRTGYQFIMFANCQADADGNCSLTARAEIFAPDGSVYGDHTWRLWDNQPSPPENLLALAPGSIAMTVEDGEQLGVYRVRLSVTDENAGATATSQVSLTFVEAGALEPTI